MATYSASRDNDGPTATGGGPVRGDRQAPKARGTPYAKTSGLQKRAVTVRLLEKTDERRWDVGERYTTAAVDKLKHVWRVVAKKTSTRDVSTMSMLLITM